MLWMSTKGCIMLQETSTADLLARTAPLYERVKAVVPPVEWPFFARDIDALLPLNRARNAAILAPTYHTPALFHSVPDPLPHTLPLPPPPPRAHPHLIPLAAL